MISNSDSLRTFLLSTVKSAWGIAVGISGIAGAATWAFLVFVAQQSPFLMLTMVLLVPLSLMIGASYRQWRIQRHQFIEQASKIDRLEDQLTRHPEIAARERAELASSVYKLLLMCDSVDSLMDEIGNQLLRELRLLYHFTRLSLYAPYETDGAPTKQTIALRTADGDVLLTVPALDLVNREYILAGNTYKERSEEHQVINDSKGGTTFISSIPIHGKVLGMTWGVLVASGIPSGDQGDQQFRANVQSLKNSFLESVLEPVFNRVAENNATSRLMQKIENEGVDFQQFYAVLRVRKVGPELNISPDRELPFLAEPERTVLLSLVEAHKDLFAKAFTGGEPVERFDEKNHLSVIPIHEEHGPDDFKRMLVVLEIGAYRIAQRASNWNALSQFLKYLCCGLYDPETKIHSQATFRMRLLNLLATSRSVSVLLIEISGGALTPDVKVAVAHLLDKWTHNLFENETWQPPARLDGYTYALLLPLKDPLLLRNQARALQSLILDELGARSGGTSGSAESVFVAGIVASSIDSIHPSALLTVLQKAMSIARSANGGIYVEDIVRLAEVHKAAAGKRVMLRGRRLHQLRKKAISRKSSSPNAGAGSG